MGPAPGNHAAATSQCALAPGTPITLSPAGAPSMLCLAEVLAWATSPSGLVVTARAVTDSASAGQLDNEHVFISGRAPDEALVVLEAVARQSTAGAGILELVSVAALAREHRRAAVRAAVTLPVILNAAAAPRDQADGAQPPETVSGTTVDLSGDGCRVRLHRDVSLSIGTEIVTVLDLGRPDPIRVTGVVVRSAETTSEIIVSFDPMPLEDAAAIDATVYAALRA